MFKLPIRGTFWVRPGRLLAGEYPGSWRERETRQRLRRLLEARVSFFLNLTEEREYGLKPYTPLLWELAEDLGRQVAHHRVAIPDMGVPTPEEMVYILDTMDFVLQAGHVVYMHCYAGIGRTGTVIGCHLVRHGMSGDEALAEIIRLRQGMPAGWKRSPSTSAQREMIRNWPKGQ